MNGLTPLRKVRRLPGSSVPSARAVGNARLRRLPDGLHETAHMPFDEAMAFLVHEVNQPLTGLLVAAENALSCLTSAPLRLDRAKQAVDLIIECGYRTADIARSVSDLVCKSRSLAVDVDINDVITRTLERLRAQVHDHAVAVEAGLAGDIALVNGDPVLLERLVTNLVNNAIGAMRQVDDRARTLRINTCQDEGGDVLVTIEDSGTGLDPAQAARIFDPFFTTKSDGMGVGLSVCRSIVESHGGRLWASPNRPHGSVFRFTVAANRAGEKN